MLGLLFIFFVGWSYYKLAEKFNRGKWGFAILGIAAYYAGSFIGGVIIGLAYFILKPESELPKDIYLSLMAIPFGLASCYGVYKLLQHLWSKKGKDLGLIDEEMISD